MYTHNAVWQAATPKQRQLRDTMIYERSLGGASAIEIADFCNMSPSSVREIIRVSQAEANADRSMIPSELAARDDEIVGEMTRGTKPTTISRRYGITSRRISEIRDRAGIAPGKTRHPKEADVLRAIGEGKTIAQIMAETGMSQNSISRARSGKPLYLADDGNAKSKADVVRTPFDDWPIKAASLVATRVLDRWFNVEPIDQNIAFDDTRPFRGGRYPQGVSIEISGCGSPAYQCSSN